jgi:hypothetical protein
MSAQIQFHASSQIFDTLKKYCLYQSELLLLSTLSIFSDFNQIQVFETSIQLKLFGEL